jgi:probable phosphoglycerate mutase
VNEAVITTTRLILVRHGESQVTVDRIIGGGLTCSGLSELGRLQTEALRDRLISDPIAIDAFGSSTMPRALETAEILQPALAHLDLFEDSDLVEHRPGEADGLPFADYDGKYGAFDLAAEPFRPLAPGGESLAGFHHRAGAALHRVVRENAGQTVLICCHGGVIDVALRSFLGLALIPTFELHTLNTSLTELSKSEGAKRWKLVRYNDSAHLVGLRAATNLA